MDYAKLSRLERHVFSVVHDFIKYLYKKIWIKITNLQTIGQRLCFGSIMNLVSKTYISIFQNESRKTKTERLCFSLIMNFVLKMNIFAFFWNESRKMKAFALEKLLVWHCYPLSPLITTTYRPWGLGQRRLFEDAARRMQNLKVH